MAANFQSNSDTCLKKNTSMHNSDTLHYEATRIALLKYAEANSQLIQEVASENHISVKSLRLLTLLYLPRLMDRANPPDFLTLMAEIKRLGLLIRSQIDRYLAWQKPPVKLLVSPRETVFTEATEAEARVIHERFHYLASFRPNSLHFGLRDPATNRLAALATLSAFDLEHVVSHLQPEIKATEIKMISRVYCFDWAPHNSISYLLGQIVKKCDLEEPKVKLLLTYVNPNMGFSGASYKASNWILFAREWGTRYAYLDDRYITDRNLAHIFGTANPQRLCDLLGPRFQVTDIPLAPLFLYAYSVDARIRHLNSETSIKELWRPE